MTEVADKKWYVVRAVSGQESKIKDYILSEIDRLGYSKMVEDILVPTQKIVQIRNGKKVSKEKTYFPGYIMIKADLSGEVPHIIKSVTNVIGFLGENYHDPRGFYVVSILLLANFFLGIYYNLSIWYKLTDRTIFGAYISIFGALITLTLNYILIPYYGFLACAVTTFCCYFLMSFISFIFLRQYFPIPYNLKRIAFYFALMIFIFFIVYFDSFGPYIHCLYLLIFLSVVYLIEQPKKSLI